MKWWKGALGLERDGLEQKAVIGLDDALAGHYDEGASRHDGTNFRTNQVTLSEYQDSHVSGTAGVLSISTALACTTLLSGTQASLPCMVYRTDAQGRRTVAYDHPLYRVLHDSPNADQTAMGFWEFVCASVELQGNAYSEIERANDGRVIALLPPILPERMKVSRKRNGDIGYDWTEGSRQRQETSSRVLHFRGFGGSPLGGLSTLALGRQTFQLAKSINNAALATFRNGMKPSGALQTNNKLNKEQRQDAEQLLQEKYVGAMNAGIPLLLDNGVTWQSINFNPDDAQMLESRAFSVEEICRLFGVPPFMVGHTEKSTSWGSGLEQQLLGFQKFTLRPRLERIEQSLMKQLLTAKDRAEGITIEFNLEGLLRGDSKSRADFYRAALGDTQKPGWMVRNEVRKYENLQPIPGWDEPIPMISEAAASTEDPETTPEGDEVEAVRQFLAILRKADDEAYELRARFGGWR